MSDLALYELRGSAAVITLNRPDKRNALSRGLIAALEARFAHAAADEDARCVILTGAGPAFCAGMDLSELQASAAANADVIWDDAYRLAQLYERIYALPKPTLAVVNGAAVAGGAGLVSVCDLAIAVPEAKFGYPEVRRGLVAALVMPHLLRHVGERMARYLLLAGELIDGAAAAQCGLVNEVVAVELLWDRADAITRAFAEGGPNALATTKQLLKKFSHQALSAEECARASAAPRLTEECRQGLDAYFTKRPPPWLTN